MYTPDRELNQPNDDHKEDLVQQSDKEKRQNIPILSANDIRVLQSDFKERIKLYPNNTEIYMHLLDSITKALKH